MKKEPLVSVIIPTYNRAQLIGETLDSVLAQTYYNWECIIVDDGSSDNTDEVVGVYVKKDKRFKYYHRPDEHLPGGNGARNYGFNMSQGEYVNWFDSDDLMMPEKLELKVKAMEENDIDFVICSMCFYLDGKSKSEQKLKIKTSLFKDYVLWDFKIVTNNILFKKFVLNQHEIFDENVLRGQETEFFSRFFWENKNMNYEIIDIPLFYYRLHKSSKTSENYVYNRKMILSQVYNMKINYLRGVSLDDFAIKKYCYSHLIQFYNKSLMNKDRKATFLIWFDIIAKIKFNSISHFLEIMVIGFLLNIFNKSSFRLEKRWKSLINIKK